MTCYIQVDFSPQNLRTLFVSVIWKWKKWSMIGSKLIWFVLVEFGVWSKILKLSCPLTATTEKFLDKVKVEGSYVNFSLCFEHEIRIAALYYCTKQYQKLVTEDILFRIACDDTFMLRSITKDEYDMKTIRLSSKWCLPKELKPKNAVFFKFRGTFLGRVGKLSSIT